MANTDSPGVILNDDALREHYVPIDLTAREGHVTRIRACLDSAGKGRKPTHLWLYGPPGAGKTAVARSALAGIEREMGIGSVRINCWQRDSLYEILDQMVTDLKIFHAEQNRSSVKLERLRRYLGKRCLMVLLDEVDKIPPAERSKALYALDDLGNVGLICISNTLGCLFDLEDRVRSRINPRTVSFSPYSAEEVVEILTRRAHLALASGSCPEYLMKRIAGVCSGDARVALQTLRNAAESAECAGRDSIKPADLVVMRAMGAPLLFPEDKEHEPIQATTDSHSRRHPRPADDTQGEPPRPSRGDTGQLPRAG